MKKLLLLLCFVAGYGSSQVTAPQIQYVTADPTGNACGATSLQLRTPNGTLYSCQSGVIAAISGGGGGGTIPSTTSALKGDGAGNAAAVTGTGSNCVHVDGTSASCPGGGATIPSVTNIIKGDGAGNGADTKVAITSPSTAATIAFVGDNETVTLPSGTLLANGGALGTPSSGTATNITGLPISTGVSGLAAGIAAFLGTPTSANLAAALTTKTGTGLAVFGTSPTLVTPALGTPSALVLTNATALPAPQVSSGALANGMTATTQSQADASTKLATTAYTDTAVANAIAGVNPAVAVQACTTAAGDTSGFTYNNGAAGIGAFFTGSVNTAVTIDGFTFTALGQRLLVKNDTQSPSGAFNGVYYVTTLQALAVAPILTRALDYDQPSDINNTGAIPCVNGTANASTSWLLTSSVATVGTDPLTYTQFSLKPSTLVTAVSPGVGIAHFAGSTQTVTSSAVNLAGADVAGLLGNGNYYGVLATDFVVTDQSTTSTSLVDLTTADTVTFTLAATTSVAVWYHAECYLLTAADAAGSQVVADGTPVGALLFVAVSTAEVGNQKSCIATYSGSLASGSHTIKVQHKSFSGNPVHFVGRLLTVMATP